MTVRLAALLFAGLLCASCAVATPQPSPSSPPPDAQGTWTLASIVEDDGTDHPAGPATEVVWKVDMATGTLVWRLRMMELWPSKPDSDIVRSLAFKVTGEGHWRMEDLESPGRWIEFAVDCTSTTLTLTRVGYEGMESASPPPPYEEGTAQPPARAPKLPPRVLRFSR